VLYQSSCQVKLDIFSFEILFVLFSDLVGKCSAGVTEATSDTLTSVMECGKEATITWVKNNARYVEIL
jgi:hypothetical protein